MHSPVRFLPVLAFVTLVVTTPAWGSARDLTIWGLDRDEFTARLAAGDHAFLSETDFSRSGESAHDLQDARRLGDEAFHTLALVFETVGRPEIAERLLRLSVEAGNEPWAGESAGELMAILETAERYAELEVICRQVLGMADAGDGADDLPLAQTLSRLPRAGEYLANAFYRQEKDVAVVTLTQRLVQAGPSPRGGAGDAERALWLAVSSSRLDDPAWPAYCRNLFGLYPADDAHSRVWVYLRANPGLRDKFAPEVLRFFDAKRSLAEGLTSDAAGIFFSLMDAGSANLLPLISREAVLRDIYLSAAGSARQSAGAVRLINLAADLEDPQSARALEYAGRLYRAVGNHDAAIRAFDESLSLLPPGNDLKRVRWYGISSRVRRNPGAAVFELVSIIPNLVDAAYHSDVFSELAGRLVEAHLWDQVLRAYEVIRDFAAPDVLATYELVLADAIGRGLLSPDTDNPAALRTHFLEQAAGRRENRFVAFVASAMLGRSGVEVIQPAPGTGGTNMAAANEGAAANESAAADATERIRAFLRYGLLDRARAAALQSIDVLPAETLFEVVDRLAAEGLPRQAVDLATRYPSGGLEAEHVMTELLPRRYPLAHAEVVEQVVELEASITSGASPVDRWILYALMREESRFDENAVSRAGAIGLTQLLPATAADIAARMRMKVPDLTNPLDNLAVGARYLVMLEEQFGGLVKAIAAYNAGQGRLRDWERLHPGLEGVLFHEAVPYAETHNHVRAIVVSAIYYSYLYDGRSPTNTISEAFGEFLPDHE